MRITAVSTVLVSGERTSECTVICKKFSHEESWSFNGIHLVIKYRCFLMPAIIFDYFPFKAWFTVLHLAKSRPVDVALPVEEIPLPICLHENL
jgi:hypothetical protein